MRSIWYVCGKFRKSTVESAHSTSEWYRWLFESADRFGKESRNNMFVAKRLAGRWLAAYSPCHKPFSLFLAIKRFIDRLIRSFWRMDVSFNEKMRWQNALQSSLIRRISRQNNIQDFTLRSRLIDNSVDVELI